MVCLTQEGIWLGGVSPWPMDEGEVNSGQEEGPVFLLAVQVLGSPEICKVHMVVQDLYCVSSSLQDMPPFFQTSDN